MLLSVLMLGGLLLSATGIAGILVTYQIREANDAENSARAFFAADAGLDWETYCFFSAQKVASTIGLDLTNTSAVNAWCAANGVPPAPTFSDVDPPPGNIKVYTVSTIVSASPSIQLNSEGYSKSAVRALEATF